jgi:hypothetical protein
VEDEERGADVTAEWTRSNVYPTWQDGEKAVELRLAKGEIVSGKLDIYDDVVDGDGDEWPLFQVILSDGKKVFLSDYEAWRFA